MPPPLMTADAAAATGCSLLTAGVVTVELWTDEVMWLFLHKQPLS